LCGGGCGVECGDLDDDGCEHAHFWEHRGDHPNPEIGEKNTHFKSSKQSNMCKGSLASKKLRLRPLVASAGLQWRAGLAVSIFLFTISRAM
jgi:hypothetical protein